MRISEIVSWAFEKALEERNNVQQELEKYVSSGDGPSAVEDPAAGAKTPGVSYTDMPGVKAYNVYADTTEAPKASTHPWDEPQIPSQENPLGWTARQIIEHYRDPRILGDVRTVQGSIIASLEAQRDAVRNKNTELEKVNRDLSDKLYNQTFNTASTKTTLKPFQRRVANWCAKTFKDGMLWHRKERTLRFLEEALELVFATGLVSVPEVIDMLQYVMHRPMGEIGNEVGGNMVTLALLCEAFNEDLWVNAEKELQRIDTPEMREKIRLKHADKPNNIKCWIDTPKE